MARTEVRKECPSCGLGVTLDAKVCEFCGWDFEEEDEWISQIEQLEQELLSEKQKTDTEKVDRMIKSTLRKPTLEKTPKAPPTPKRPIAITVRKAAPPKKEKIPVEDFLADEEKVKPAMKAARPAAVQIKPKISIKIDREEIPPPPEEIEAPRPSAPARPVVAPKVTLGKKVRRVVSTPKPSSVKPAAVKPAAPVRQRPATTHSKPAVVATPPTKEKKGLFGGLTKMLSMEAAPPTVKTTPTKTAPAKTAPSKIAKAPAPAKKETPPPAKPPVSIKVFVCPLCKTEVKETEKSCPNCGAEFE